MRALALTLLLLMGIIRLQGADPLDTWHLRHVIERQQLDISGIAFGNGVFVVPVAGGNQGTVFRSLDGREWTRHLISLQDFVPISVRFAGGLFFSGGGASVDGLVWRSSKTNVYPAWDGNLFVSSSPFRITSVSTNGFEWSDHSTGDVFISSIAYGAGLFVASGIEHLPCCDYEVILTSTDGVIWTFRRSVKASQQSLSGQVLFGNGRFVKSNSGTNLISTDGLTWNEVPTSFSPFWFLNGLFVSPFSTFASPNFFSTSVDGVTFSTNTFSTNTLSVYDLAFGNQTFVALAYNWTSGNSEIWQSDPVTNSPPVAPGVNIGMYPGLTVTGTPGKPIRIEYRESIAPTNAWQTLTNTILPASPWLFIDTQSATRQRRFYRAVTE